MTISCLTSLGPFVAAIVALFIAIFHEQLSRLFWHPTLEIRFENQPPDSNLMPVTNIRSGAQADCYYFRIRVYNTGNTRAENVEVFIEEVRRRGADSTFERWRNFIPLNLLWSHYQQPYFPAIPQGTYKHCDLGHIIDPGRRQEFPGEDYAPYAVTQQQTLLYLALIVPPSTGIYLVPPGFYHLTIVAVAANARLTRRTIEINQTGRWFPNEPDMLREGIGIRLL